MSTISKLRRVCLAVVITFSVCLSATSKEELSVKPTAKELVNLYKKAVTCWDKSVAMRVETEHSMAKRGTDETDIRHWKYDITHSREGDRCEWFGSCQFEGEHDGDEYSFNEQFTKKVGDDFFLYYIKRDSGEEPEFALMGSNVKEKLFILQAQESDAGFLQGRMGGIGSAPKMVNVMCESKNLNLTQGAKRVVLGGDTYVYDTHHFLITSVDIPTTVQVIKASHQKPCLGLVLKLDLREISQLVVDGNLPQPRVEPSSRGMALGEVTLPMLDAFKRLIDLLDEPKDIPILAPVVKREIFYRILVGNQGTRLRQMASAGSPSHQIARAIDWIKDNFTEPLHVENLSSYVHMSKSTFHHHFRKMTAMSPLQYQKWLRLNEARRLMLTESLDAGMAAFQVGYESPSQFSREYSRLFGNSPLRDVTNLRQVTSSILAS